MGKYLRNRCLLAFLAIALCATNVFAGKVKKEVYIPMDYSTCGYHASEKNIPDVHNAVYVEVSEGDCHDVIQRAIDYVSSLKPDKNGHRGAVLLGEGTFYIDNPLRISTSGVVIRGTDRSKTTLVKRGVSRGALLYIEGGMKMTGGDTLQVVGDKTMAGATTLNLSSTGNIKVGDRIRVVRPSTREWIESLNCYDFGGGLD